MCVSALGLDKIGSSNLDIFVVKKDGSKEAYNAQLVNEVLVTASVGISDFENKINELRDKLESLLFNGITTNEISETLLKVGQQYSFLDKDYELILSRLSETTSTHNEAPQIMQVKKTGFGFAKNI